MCLRGLRARLRARRRSVKGAFESAFDGALRRVEGVSRARQGGPGNGKAGHVGPAIYPLCPSCHVVSEPVYM